MVDISYNNLCSEHEDIKRENKKVAISKYESNKSRLPPIKNGQIILLVQYKAYTVASVPNI